MVKAIMVVVATKAMRRRLGGKRMVNTLLRLVGGHYPENERSKEFSHSQAPHPWHFPFPQKFVAGE
jgi:hypothetical protein